MNSSPLSLVYRPAIAALASSAIVFALATAACTGSVTSSAVDATDPGDGGAGSPATSPAPDASTPTTTPPVTAEAACASHAKAQCARAKACGEFLFGAMWGDAATCEARVSLGCVDKLSESGVTWKPEGLMSCADSLAAASCDDLALGILPAACAPTPGTLSATDSCVHDEQCSTGFCKKGSFGACGSCAERAKAGASCSRGSDCAAGLLCANRSCRAPAAQGQSCSTSRPCSPGLVCNGGTCAKGAPAGSSCAETPTSPDPCDRASGVFCSSLLMQCSAAKVVASGESCNPFFDVCAAGGTCDGFGNSGSCRPPPREGDSCTVSGSGAGCFAPSVCELGKCVVPTAAACTKS